MLLRTLELLFRRNPRPSHVLALGYRKLGNNDNDGAVTGAPGVASDTDDSSTAFFVNSRNTDAGTLDTP